MKKAFVFPGQGSQAAGMGKSLYDTTIAKKYFDDATDILGFDIKDIMFNGTADDLKQTKVTQPAIFLHSVAAFYALTDGNADMVAGHSLGEFSALVAAGVLSFEHGLKLVKARAEAMQQACEASQGTMAAVLGLDDEKVAEICNSVAEVVAPANYNCPGQVVISGSLLGIEMVTPLLKEAGAKRVLPLPVSGAFHSPLMQPAVEAFKSAIEIAHFSDGKIPVYQNVNAQPSVNSSVIKANILLQLTGAVLWTQSVRAMYNNGATQFIEVGPGNVLQGLIKKIAPDTEISGIS